VSTVGRTYIAPAGSIPSGLHPPGSRQRSAKLARGYANFPAKGGVQMPLVGKAGFLRNHGKGLISPAH
jgi:hypothetical protein